MVAPLGLLRMLMAYSKALLELIGGLHIMAANHFNCLVQQCKSCYMCNCHNMLTGPNISKTGPLGQIQVNEHEAENRTLS